MRNAISIHQSERERVLAESALTLGQDEILSGEHVIVWSVLGETTGSRPEAWLGSVLSELRDLLALSPGWDSYGGAAIDAEVAAMVIDILNVLARDRKPRPALVPTSAGGIQVEWYTSDIELQLEVRPGTKTIELFYRDGGSGTSWQGPLGEEPESLDALLWRVALAV